MKDQKISTTLGTVILIIISATIGGFVLFSLQEIIKKEKANNKNILFIMVFDFKQS